MKRCAGSLSGVFVILALIGWPMTAHAQPLLDLPLENLMRLDAGRVYGASERAQPVTEAPASVSFITAQEIERYGYRTLADILRGVRGLYVTDDRNFSYLGARGFGKPGDYNSRILLLVNGHRVNDNVFGQAEIGAEFGLDPATYERVEIIRGPASSLYGDSAFFAVVNVITKTGASLNGASIALDAGTLGTGLVRGSVGHRFANGADMAVSGSFEGSDGVDRLYYPVFDTPETNNGIAEGLDGERVGQFYSRFSFKKLSVTAAYGARRRIVPTASFGTLFNEQVFREQTTDRHTLLDAEYSVLLDSTRLDLRGSYDRFTYDGIYPFAGETPEQPLVGHSDVIGTRWTAGARVTHTLPWRQTLKAGVEFIDNLKQNQFTEYLDPPTVLLDSQRSSTQHAVYAQDELKLSRWFILNAGFRYDSYEDFSRVTPRTAVIFMPSSYQSFKYLYGGAFRAPNAHERNAFYFGERVSELRPETIATHEIVWERYTGDWLRTSVSTYWYNANRLITLIADPEAFLGGTYVNEGKVNARGLEAEAQMRLRGGVEGVVSYALQEARDQDTDELLVNSPRHMGRLRLSRPFSTPRSSLAFELSALSSRKLLSGNTLGAVATVNVNVIQPLSPSLQLVGNIRNLFDLDYADPSIDQHRQDTIPQNGRTLRIGVRWTLPNW